METPPSHSLAPPSAPSPPSQSHAPPQLMSPASAFVPPQGLSLASPAPSGAEANLMHKSRLNEYCQKSGLPTPVFQVVNEGSCHAPRFRCTVWVYGKSFASPNTFLQRRAAEHDAAKLALQQLVPENKAIPSIDLRKLVSQDKSLSKMIVNEFAAKMNLGKCTYETVQVKDHSFPMSVSSVVLNGTRYKGDVGKNKKEAEQLAAHAALLSLLDDPTYGASLSEVIMPKLDLYAAFLGKDFERNFSVINEAVKTTTVDNNMPAPLNQQVAAVEQSSSRVMVNKNMPETVNSECKSVKQDGSCVLADKQGDSGVVGDENMPEMVNSQAKTQEQVGHGVLAHEQGNSGVLGDENMPEMVNSRAKTKEQISDRVLADEHGGSGVLANDSETLFTLAPCHAPVTVTPKPCVEAQPSPYGSAPPHPEPSISQQISLAIQSTPSATTVPGQDSVSSTSRKRRRNKKNKANKRLQTENSDAADVPRVPLNQPHPCSVAQ